MTGELVQGPGAGDVAGLFRAHHAELVRLAVLLVRDQPTAEDVVQDVFARLHARPGRLPGGKDGLSYARAAVLNGCRSVLRRRAVARRRGVDSGPAGAGWIGGSGTGWSGSGRGATGQGGAGWGRAGWGAAEAALSAEREAILAEDRRQVLAALAALPARRREVLVLRYYLGLSEAEIAAVLGIRPGTVKSTAARGLAALARALGEDS